ncbi:hypothetical protein KAS45_02860 [candidate division WOR-3 bacterium]|nr:hypothetical protein [candidate division WOR-3 bacterium]
MKFRLLLVSLIAFSLFCTKGVVTKVNKIEVIYLGSLYQDIYREEPVSAGISHLPGIKLGHTLTEPVFMEYFMHKIGLYQLLNDLELDFVITDSAVYNQHYFPIPKSMGFALENFGDIRLAILSKDKDSLNINEQVQFSLVKERSDVLWVIDRDLLSLDPSVITFYITHRSLSDTSLSPIQSITDTARTRKVAQFREKMDQLLNKKISTAGRVDEHLFSVLAQKEELDVIIYPDRLFVETVQTDSVSLRELMHSVAFEMRFKKVEMSDDEILDVCAINSYNKWGSMEKTNSVLLPDKIEGQHIFDFYYEKE